VIRGFSHTLYCEAHGPIVMEGSMLGEVAMFHFCPGCLRARLGPAVQIAASRRVALDYAGLIAGEVSLP